MNLLDAKPCLVVAEVAQSHDGSLGLAHAFIDAVARAGADAIKFQTHIAAAESSPDEPWRVHFSPQDASRYDYWKRMEFCESQWLGLAEHARRAGLAFLSSPFSDEAVTLLEKVGVDAWKTPSGEVGNPLLLERMAATGLPVLLSSGMSPFAELDEAVALVKRHRAPLAVLQCTTSYPCPPEKIGLNLLAELRDRYGCPVGLSDHSGTIFPGLAAAALGARVIEVHVTLSREMFGPDVPASVTTSELAVLVSGVRDISAMLAHPVDKDAQAREMQPLRDIFCKSVAAARDLTAGTVLTPDDLALRKPGTGIPARLFRTLPGRRLVRAMAAGVLIHPDDLGEAP